MVHIADTLLTHICPLPTSCIQKIPRDNLRSYGSRATLSRQKRPSHFFWGERGKGKKGGKLTTWKKLGCAFYLQGQMTIFSPSICFKRQSLWSLPPRLWQRIQGKNMKNIKIQQCTISFFTDTILEAAIQVNTHVIMPQKINKKQICEKTIGPSHYPTPGSQLYLILMDWDVLYLKWKPCKNEVNRTRCKR